METSVKGSRIRSCSFFAPLVLLLLFAVVPDLRAQGLFSGGFERDVNRYRWTGEIHLTEQVKAWQLDVSNNFRSDAFILFNDRLSFRDENHTNLNLGRRFEDRQLSFSSRTGWYSLSRVFIQDLLAGYRFPLTRQVWLEPVVGASVDQRPGFSHGTGQAPLRTDAGPTAGIRLSIPPTLMDEYMVQVTGEAVVKSISPRRGDYLRATGRAERTFEKTRVQTTVQVASVRRDAYQAASFLNRDDAIDRVEETVESTRSDTMAATILVDLPVSIGTTVAGRLDFSANRRRVESLRAPENAIFFDSEFSRRVVEGELSTTFARNQSLFRLSVQAGAEVERRHLTNDRDLPPAQASQKLNLLNQADFDRGYVLIQANTRFPVGRSAVIQADISANILRHDTPEVNPDDRDELYYNGLLGINTKLTRFVELQLQVFGTYYHTVYLKAERSAENNVQYSLRLRPTLIWRPSRRSRISLIPEVRANYTIDDFLLPGRRPTDQSARELSYTIDAEHELGRGVRILVSGKVSDLRLGRFLNDTFAEIPFDTLRTTSTWVRLKVGERVQAEVGVRTFIRSDFDRSTTVRYEIDDGSGLQSSVTRPGRRQITQIGPTTAVIWPLSGGSFLRLDGWATIQSVTNRLYGELPEGMEQAIRKAARSGTRTLIPNLAVTMQWSF